MKTMMKLLAMVMALTMVLCLVACGNNEPPTTDPSTEATTKPTTGESEPSSEPTDNGLKTYTITVKDSQGNPHAGLMVQICLESCVPGMTNADGVATFELPEEAGYSAGVSSDYDATKVYFEAGQYDVTITWDAPSAE